MTLNESINTIHTPCKSCVFAIYNDKTQTDCALHYIDKYRNNHIDILEAYDDEKEFYIINGKKCIGYRENKWFKQFDLDDADLEEKIKKYHETNVLDYIVVVDLKDMTLEHLDDTLHQISDTKIQPKKVILIRYNDNQLLFPYSTIEAMLKKYNASYKWRIQTILDSSLEHRSIIHNITHLNGSYRFIMCVNKHNNDLTKIVDLTNQKVHHDLDQFDIIANSDKSCLIYSSVIFRFETFHNRDFLDNPDNYTIV